MQIVEMSSCSCRAVRVTCTHRIMLTARTACVHAPCTVHTHERAHKTHTHTHTHARTHTSNPMRGEVLAYSSARSRSLRGALEQRNNQRLREQWVRSLQRQWDVCVYARARACVRLAQSLRGVRNSSVCGGVHWGSGTASVGAMCVDIRVRGRCVLLKCTCMGAMCGVRIA